MEEIEVLKETIKILQKRDKAIEKFIHLLKHISDIEGLINEAIEITKETIPCIDVVFMTLDEKTKELKFYPPKNEEEITSYEEERYKIISESFKKIKTEEEFKNENLPHIILPLKREKKVYGIIGIFNEKDKIYNKVTVKLAESITNCFIELIENAKLLSKLDGEIRQMNYLFKVFREISIIEDRETFFNRIVEIPTELIQAEGSSLLIFNENEKKLEFVAVTGPEKEKLKGLKIEEEQGIAGFVFKEKRPAIVNETDKNEHFNPKVDNITGFITRNIAAVPLKTNSNCIGVLECVNKIEGGIFTADDLMHIELFSELITPLILKMLLTKK